jgi:hypothetical protein
MGFGIGASQLVLISWKIILILLGGIMKTISVVLAFIAFLGIGCAKKVSDDEVAAKLSEVMCMKMQECAPPSTFDQASCAAVLKGSYLAALGFAGKKGEVKDSELNHCITDIKGLKCESIAEPNPPSSCSFLKR